MYVPKHRFYAVFVPAAGSRLYIDPRSGIVAREPVADEPAPSHVMVWFEGNRLGAENLTRYVERVNNSAGRADQSYPTIAKQLVPREELVNVGRYDLQDGRLEVTDLAALTAWLEGEPLELAMYPHGQYVNGRFVGA